MASSVFADSPMSTNESRMCGGDTQSNLVVVYGKNGITVDRNGLENLMDEKNVSSISVVRITSPTPSMKSDKDDEESKDLENVELDLISKLEFSEKHEGKEPAEIVGLTVEEFYPPEEAKKLAKEILNYAGVINPLEIAIDYEFQRFVIQNDHCYTPLTSPSQVKVKTATPVTNTDNRNLNTAVRQYVNKSKKVNDTSEQEGKLDKNERETEEEEEYSEYSESTGSDDTDNDRDSDLDFNLNDRGRRPRKASLKKTRKVLPKISKKRHSVTEKDYSSTGHSSSLDDERRNSLSRSRRQSVESKKGISSTNSTVASKPIQKIVNVAKPIIKRSDISDIEKSELQLQSIEPNSRTRTYIPTSDIKTQPSKILVIKKEQKKSATPSGVFTDINTLLTQNDSSIKQTVKVQEIKVQQHQAAIEPLTRIIQQPSPSTKGFMPLGVESAAKNQLPAQISIRTHTNSSDITAEHDKQLDLIDSIVKNEMQKSNLIVKDTMNENIPQIVRMLENTEKAILNQSKNIDITRISTTTSSSSFTNSVEDIDIANAPLLDSAEDEITEDLLQHVAELIEQKNLQEAIEKQAKQTSISPTESTLFADPQPNDTLSPVLDISEDTNQKQLPTVTVKKEPIQIVRGNGRVITLPPIEAPTTRAKRRAQVQTFTSTPNSSQKSAIVVKVDSAGTQRESMEQKTGGKKRASISSQNPRDDEGSSMSGSSDSEDDPDRLWCICRQPHNNRFMICCDKCEDWFHGTCVNITKAMGLEMEQNGIEWTCPKCLRENGPQLKKPMQRKITEIFEKKPLDETKKPIVLKKIPPSLMIRKTDQKKPPEIMRKPLEGIQKKLMDMAKRAPELQKKSPEGVVKIMEMTSPAETRTKHEHVLRSPQVQSPQQNLPANPVSNEDSSMLSCIVCKKSARPNSIYCSDDCIRRHAQNALTSATKALKSTPTGSTPHSPAAPGDEKKKKIPSSFEEALAKASEPTFQIKNKIERVYVFERKTGRILTGSNAPTTANLKKWLQENPTFEVVQPGSPQALAIEKNKQQKPRPNVTEVTPTIIIKKQPETIKILKPQVSEPNRSSTPKLQKYPPQVSLKPGNTNPSENKSQTIQVKIIKKQTSTEQKPQTPTPTNETEPIRLNVKRTLKEQLISRMKEMNAAGNKLSNAEIEQFSNETENEMFKLFNKDTGAKYKAKYRSLMFNIKDRKNQTLFQKICEKKIEPKQLVRMSPEELASQELAQWRQNENKHQLEMIKKSELDLLSCAKNYVLKTHKGEEVIESKSTDRVSLDFTIPVEDVVAVLNNSTVSSTSEINLPSPNTKDAQKFASFENSNELDSSLNSTTNLNKTANSMINVEKKKSKSKDRDRDRHHRSKEKHKSRKRSRSRSRSRDRRHKSPTRDETYGSREKREKQENREKYIAKMKIKQKEIKPQRPNITRAEETQKSKEYNLIDKILESSKTVEQAANLIIEKEKPTLKEKTATNPKIENSISGVDSDQEPTSTVVIATPPKDQYQKYSSDISAIIWTGSINMIDVATFQIVVQPVSGVCNDLKKELPLELDVVGRISPETVWDYIGKIKKSPNKEIVIIRLLPSCESENIAYTTLYTYLDKRKRLGVVKTTSPNIKDFYVVPLEAMTSLPSVMQSLDNLEFFNDDTRPDLLLGIVIRIMGKRPSAVQSHHLQSKIARKINDPPQNTSTSSVTEEERFTPPHSPRSFNVKKGESKSIIAASRLPPKSNEPIDIDSILTTSPKIPKAPYIADDADEPYSPGGSSDEDLNSIAITSSSTTVNPMTDDLKRKMDEINRQIEAQKMEIAGMLNMDQSSSSKTYSPSHSPTNYAPALANISIPSDLQQILASIKPTEAPQSIVPPPPLIGSLVNEDDDEEYVPAPSSAATFKATNCIPYNQTKLEISLPKVMDAPTPPTSQDASGNQSTSRLAQLSEAELLSLVPDKYSEISKPITKDIMQHENEKLNSSLVEPTPAKKPRWDTEPPPPGLEDEFM